MEGLEDRCLLSFVPASVAIDHDAYDPSRILVRFRPETAEANGAGIVRGTEIGRPMDIVPGLRSVHLPQGLSVEAALAAYRANASVLYAEPNYRVRTALTPNDPQFSALYGLENTGQTGGLADADIDAPAAWDLTTGSQNVVVAVIDTGVDYTHSDLAANMWVNSGEVPGNNADDDGNGFIDDVYGYDFANYDGDPFDDNLHGTHVAGTIGAVGNNGIGVAGVSWSVKVMALKFLDAGGSGYIEDALNAVNYAVMMRNNGVNVRLTSNSWGGGGYSQALLDAIDASGAAGILFAAAAGNSGTDADASPMYPAAYDSPYIVSVAATDHADEYASFSNWGATTVDLAAPGVDILSTLPGNQYGYLSGTSMATPHFSGAAALVWSLYPDATPLQVKQRLLAGADYVGHLGGNSFRPTLTNGRLNVSNALEDDTIPPASISGLSAVESGMTSVTLTWTATGDDGAEGTAASYDVRYSTAPITDANWESATRAPGAPKPKAAGTTETFAVSGLNPNQTYYFAIRALDNVGNASPLSNALQASTQPATVLYEDDMESGAPGWQASGLWHLATWRSSSPLTAFYYGDDSSLTYDTYSCDDFGCYSYPNSGTLTSPPINLSGAADALLTFTEWRQVENLAPYDRAAVLISSDGVNWTAAWESYSSTNDWAERTLDLTPWAGGSIYIQFHFDTVDEVYNYFEGWYVDDVKVWTAGSQEPGLYVNDVSVAESDQGAVEATFTVSLVDTTGPVTVHWATADGTATAAGNDYQAASGTLSFADGQTSQTFSVWVNGDRIDEANENFFVNLSGAAGAAIVDGQGRAAIVDNDTAGITLDAASGLVTSENGGGSTLSVVLNSEPAADVTINLSSSDTTEGVVSPASLTFTSANWSTPQSAVVTGVNDLLDDGDVWYVVSASAVSADGAYNGLAGSLTAKNLDNDYSVTYASSNVPKNIPDGGTVLSTLMAGAHMVLDVNVQLNIKHARVEDLDVYLTAPNGTKVELFTDVGGAGKNFTNTVLDDEASAPITSGAAPFSGSYRPEGSLAAFDGKNSQGVWVLSVSDDKKGQKGTLNQWSITVLYEELSSSSTSADEGPIAESCGAAADSPPIPALIQLPTSNSYPAAPTARAELADRVFGAALDDTRRFAPTHLAHPVRSVEVTSRPRVIEDSPQDFSNPSDATSISRFTRLRAIDDSYDAMMDLFATNLGSIL
ncbi:MAG: S8 family serine peptidase [Pirellulales bacterium]